MSSRRSVATSGGAREQVARLLALVPYLYARGDGVTLDRAAQDLAVPGDQLVADLKVLFMCGLPGGYPDDLIDVDLDALEAEEGDGVLRVSNADYLARPLRLTATEASALIVALRALRSGSGQETAEVVDRALAKLEITAAEAAAIDPGEADAGLAALRARLEAALRAGTQLRLTYWVPSRDEESVRVVDPIGLISSGGFDYLDAFCHEAEAPRTFRLDRIHDAVLLDSLVAANPPSPSAERSRDRLLSLSPETATAVTLEIGPGARWVPDYYPIEAVRVLGDERWEVDLLVADAEWLTRLVLRLAPDARVLSPDWLADDVRREAHAAMGLYTVD
jgi:proteasome accessory factor C